MMEVCDKFRYSKYVVKFFNVVIYGMEYCSFKDNN